MTRAPKAIAVDDLTEGWEYVVTWREWRFGDRTGYHGPHRKERLRFVRWVFPRRKGVPLVAVFVSWCRPVRLSLRQIERIRRPTVED